MSHPGPRQYIRLAATIFDLAALGTMGFVGFGLQPHSKYAPLFNDIITTATEQAPTIIVSCGAIIVVARTSRWLAAERHKSDLIIERRVAAALDKFRAVCFPNINAQQPRDNHRVTIFRHVQSHWFIWPWRCWCWPWGVGRGPASGWLVQEHRSGHATKHNRAAFLAPDDAPNAEGVAGKAWRCDGAIRIRNLPDLSGVRYPGVLRRFWLNLRIWTKQTNSGTERFIRDKELVEKYAEAGNCSSWQIWQRVRYGKPSPRSVVAIPLETNDNRRWGVLVLDSFTETESIDTEETAFRSGLTKLRRVLDEFEITRE